MHIIAIALAAITLLAPLTLADTPLPPTITPYPPSPTPETCLTLTSTDGPSCTAISSCIRLACLQISTVTQSCGCDTIPTVTSCETICPTGCAISYAVVHPPCPTSPSPRPSYSASTTETETPPSYTPKPKPTTSKHYGNSTITKTSTTITTLTSCPAKATCHGQTSTWTGTEGPFPCPTTSCSCVLPGNGVVTVTGVTSVTLGGSATVTQSGEGGGPAGSATTSGAVLATDAAVRVVGGSGGITGWVVGVVGLWVGLL